jgi:hypothetical protein
MSEPKSTGKRRAQRQRRTGRRTVRIDANEDTSITRIENAESGRLASDHGNPKAGPPKSGPPNDAPPATCPSTRENIRLDPVRSAQWTAVLPNSDRSIHSGSRWTGPTELRPANHAIEGTVVEHVNSACGVQNGMGKGT